jgi:hypothetical protein
VEDEVTDLADLRWAPVDQDLEGPAADRATGAVRVGQHVCSGGDRHPGTRLGLPIHDAQFPAVAATLFGECPRAIRTQAAAGLGHLAQRGQVRQAVPARGDQVEGMRHGGQGRDAFGLQQGPQVVVDEGPVGQDDRGARGQVGVQHRQPVAVVQRQRRCRDIARSDAETGDDVVGVRVDGGVRQPDQLGGSGRS